MGSADGGRKAAAARHGMTLGQYLDRIASGEKWCGACKEWHPQDSFGNDGSRADGLSTVCLSSRVVADGRPGARERRIMAARGLAWCRGCLAWLPKAEISQGACRTHLNKEARGHYAKNPGPTRARKLARARGLDVIPSWWREQCFEDFGGACAYGCGGLASTIDHVWPVALGGQSRPDNLVPACHSCNSRKKASDPRLWIRRFAMAFPNQFIDFSDLNIHHGGVFDEEYEVA